MTFQQAFINYSQSLQEIYSEGESNSILRIVFEDVFKIQKADYHRDISENEVETLKGIRNRLLENEPIQYILGEADFYGLKFRVNASVLIPRSETEELVYWILEVGKKEQKNPNFSLLDIGTGSGCIPITLKKKMPEWTISAIDIDNGALKIAQENADLNNVFVRFVQSDILDKKGWSSESKYDIIVSNPPYIPGNEKHLMPANVLGFEPNIALFVTDENPLVFYETIADFALKNLKPEGNLFFEMNEFNAIQVKNLLNLKGFQNTEIRKDINGKNRMIRANL